MKIKTIIPFIILSFSTLIISAQTTWSLDKGHSKIGFAVSHMGISEVEGSFGEFDGSVTSNSDDFIGSKVEFAAKTASVNTANERRDGHLRSDDFFNAETYPELTFNGEIVKEGDAYFLVGDLTMRDVTQKEKFNVNYNGTIQGRRGPVSGFKIQGAINRFDYKLKFDRAMPGGDLVVGKMVNITANIEMGAAAE